MSCMWLLVSTGKYIMLEASSSVAVSTARDFGFGVDQHNNNDSVGTICMTKLNI